MNIALIKYQLKKLASYLAVKNEEINHRAVIRTVAANAERSWVYFCMLTLASIIALLGLLTNSVAVVIGAMLISPLMGPIISSSLAFTIGDLNLARRAFKMIGISVTLTILVCTLITFFSPLKEPTAEILARVRPNVFDLFVAMLSGIVGAIALCTKRSYLITSSGVAIATAVIPPLSVVGYGLGTGQVMLALGGFLLFFTNFVAIVLTSDLVFFVLGFRTSHTETSQHSPRKRLLIITCLLMLISIPLVYTLIVDLRKVKEKKRIERVLKEYLNKDLVSRMTGYDYVQQGNKLLVTASVNTVKFIELTSESSIEKELSEAFSRPVDVRLEQLIVASEKALNQQQVPESKAVGSSAGKQPDTAVQVKGKVDQMVMNAERELGDAVAPFPLVGTTLTFAGAAQTVHISVIIKRDYLVSQDENLLLTRLLERSLGMPVILSVETTALFPPLSFDGAGGLTPSSREVLEIISKVPEENRRFRFVIIGPPKEIPGKLQHLKQYLVQKLGVPADAILIRSEKGSESIRLRMERPSSG
ncbi:TIGR00341 family protein [Pelotalea chapellei]|uniref:TIGR00341 family protein n=1 Tax=Pelotalea chapellei TaxID=44671 RepID=A0ABS5U3T1_9BACT|nr:TIGR00341 family protein [Pelotalea chapellei]MBT1070317.1 TIGR00341 family protein [Pelotalea chapellei]